MGSGGENLRGDVVVFHLAAGLGDEDENEKVTLPTCGGNGRRETIGLGLAIHHCNDRHSVVCFTEVFHALQIIQRRRQ